MTTTLPKTEDKATENKVAELIGRMIFAQGKIEKAKDLKEQLVVFKEIVVIIEELIALQDEHDKN